MPSQYFFSCPDCGTDSLSSEYFFMAYAGLKVTRWCEKCRSLFDACVPGAASSGP
jgi:hypothetical protein